MRTKLSTCIIGSLFLICPTIFSMGQGVSTSPEDKTEKVMYKYGITLSQSLAYKQSAKEKEKEVQQIKLSRISKLERQKQMEAAILAHLQRVQAIFTPEQFAKYEKNSNAIRQRNKKVNEIIKEYKKEIAQTHDLETIEKIKAREKLEAIYISRLTSYLDREAATRRIERINISRAAGAAEVKALKLPKKQALQMATQKLKYEKEMAELRSKNLPAKVRKANKEDLDQDYRQKVKKIIGDAKYGQWIARQEKAHETKYWNKFGFSPTQYEKYKEIENRQAVEITKVKQSHLQPSDKKQKIQALKDAKIKELKTVLSAGQFEKWYGSYTKLENKRNTQRTNKSKPQ